MENSSKQFEKVLPRSYLFVGETISKSEANYNSLVIEQCKYCTNFESPSSCKIVEGEIAPNGWCEYYTYSPGSATGEYHQYSSVTDEWKIITTGSTLERRKFEGQTKAELLHAYNTLKNSGPHPKNSIEYKRMRELNIAIRKKSNWGLKWFLNLFRRV